MKSYLKIYLKFALFILITFTITSLIMAGIISFIHLSNFIYHSIINIIAGIIMIVWAFWLIKIFQNKAIIHALLCGLIFGIIALMVNIEDINLINILSRPIILIITTLILQLYTKKLDKLEETDKFLEPLNLLRMNHEYKNLIPITR